MRYESVLSKFSKLKPGRDGRSWTACCPVHGDRQPSLFLFVGHQGQLMAVCQSHYGCEWRDIVRATGTREQDWFPGSKKEAKRVSKEIAATYDYRDELGDLLYQVVRFEPKGFSQRRPSPNTEGWTWDMEGVRKVPYRLPEIISNPNQPVIVTEGEKDADILTHLGLVATTNVGGAGKWTSDLSHCLRGRRVAIIPDHDAPGWRHAALVAGSLIVSGAESVRIVRLSGICEGQDLTDWLEQDRTGDLREAVLCQIRRAPEWRSMECAA